MFRFATCLLFLLLIPLCGSAFSAEDYDIRKVRWGMTKEEVKKSEPMPVAKDTGELLIYTTKMLDFPCFLIYQFDQGKLQEVSYMFQPESQGIAGVIFLSLSSELERKYKEKESSVLRDRMRMYEGERFAVNLGQTKGPDPSVLLHYISPASQEKKRREEAKEELERQKRREQDINQL